MNSRKAVGPYLATLLFHLSSMVLAATLLAPLTAAQGGASLSGEVIDSTGAGIPDASVRVINVETGAERNLSTDEAGRFSAQALAVGRYEVTVTKEGFRADTRSGIALGTLP